MQSERIAVWPWEDDQVDNDSEIVEEALSMSSIEVSDSNSGNVKRIISEIQSPQKTVWTSSQAKVQSAPKSPEEIVSGRFDNLVDIVDVDGDSAYLVNTSGGHKIEFSWHSGGDTLIPPEIKRMLWTIPQGTKVLQYINNDSDKALYEDLVDHLRSVSELPDERHYNMLAIWLMHTYLQERIQYSPIICLIGDAGMGKSRIAKALTYMSYRGVLTLRMDESWIMRLADEAAATLCFDIFDAWEKSRSSRSEDMILYRFERGAKIPRILDHRKGLFEGTRSYDIFGPTIIVSNNEVDDTLASRSLLIRMQRSKKLFNDCVTPQTTSTLRDRLTAFRARHMASTLPDVMKPINGRLGDITRPLLQVSELAVPEATSILSDLIHEIERTPARLHLMTPEAKFLCVVDSLRDKVRNGHLPVKLITDVLNSSKLEIEHVTYQKAGRMLKMLGFHNTVISGNNSGLVWNEELLQQLLMQYGVISQSSSAVGQYITSDITAEDDIVLEGSELSDLYDDQNSDKEGCMIRVQVAEGPEIVCSREEFCRIFAEDSIAAAEFCDDDIEAINDVRNTVEGFAEKIWCGTSRERVDAIRQVNDMEQAGHIGIKILSE
ncbi:MAG: hypothetical protein ACYC0V_01635 [Armatimonadota bacterium]